MRSYMYFQNILSGKPLAASLILTNMGPLIRMEACFMIFKMAPSCESLTLAQLAFKRFHSIVFVQVAFKARLVKVFF